MHCDCRWAKEVLSDGERRVNINPVCGAQVGGDAIKQRARVPIKAALREASRWRALPAAPRPSRPELGIRRGQHAGAR